MTLGRIANIAGASFIAAALAGSCFFVARRSAVEADGSLIVLHISHWQLESGMREAYDEIGREYTRLHPNVRIEQLAAPGRVYGAYVRTQLTGDDPPDLMEVGGVSDEWLARYFQPISAYIEKPNPYNRGTDLENTPWRDTFLDGLASTPGLETALEYYSVPNTMVTVRMYANRALYREITGGERPPATYEEFLDVCRKTREFAVRTGRNLFPLAGSRFNANILLDRLFRSQTQTLSLACDPLDSLRAPGAFAFLHEGVTLDTPAIRSGLQLMREVALQMPAGFMQFDRDNAIFHFGQEHALMIATGSWDYRSIESQSPFPVLIFAIPLPRRENPTYGVNVLGAASEAGSGMAGHLFLSARSKHPETAIDFLQFLTSREGDQMFVNRSKWLPAVRGVKTPDDVLPFAPAEDGYPDGFAIAPIMWGSGEMYRIQSNHLNQLFDTAGSVDAFVGAMKLEMDAALRSDLNRIERQYTQDLRRTDLGMIAGRRLNAASIASRWEAQNAEELMSHWLRAKNF